MTLFDLRAEGKGRATSPPLLTIRVAEIPQGKARPRFRTITPRAGRPFTTTYTPAKTKHYELLLARAALDAMGIKAPFEGPLEILVFAYFPIPPSWSDKKRAAALDGEIRPTGKPDFDNVGKAVSDSFNEIVYRDDAQITDGRVIKLYAQRQPGIIVEVRRAGPAPTPWREPNVDRNSAKALGSNSD